jgi:hypothetical protein
MEKDWLGEECSTHGETINAHPNLVQRPEWKGPHLGDLRQNNIEKEHTHTSVCVCVYVCVCVCIYIYIRKKIFLIFIQINTLFNNHARMPE